jgi:glycosyltransferase involved in cell wall biosynthesis
MVELKKKIKKRPAILLINWQDWTNPLSGGAEVHLHEIFKRLARDFNISLLCTHFKNAPKFEEIDGIKIYRAGFRNAFNFFVPRAYKRITTTQKFDLVIEDLNKIPFFGGNFVREKRIAILHHLFGKEIYTETNPLFGSYVYFSERLIPKFYRTIPIIAISESSRNEIVRMGISEANVKVIYNGVDLNLYQSKVKKREQPVVICLNRMKKYKRMDVLIESIPEVLKEIPDLKVIFVGDGDDLPRLKEITRKNKIEDIVDFTNFVSEKKKIELLSSSWVSVNTSPKEGWGLTSIEAQVSGTPSIVPDSPGLRETVKNGVSGFIYPFGDKKTLSKILIRILKDKKTLEKMGKEARKWAANFSWDRSAKKMKGIIESNLNYWRD